MEKHKLTYRISDVAPYINWPYFYFAWQISDKAEQQRMRQEAEDVLQSLGDKYRTHALFAICGANSDGDDIVTDNGTRIPMLRQQRAATGGQPCLCLADFIRPGTSGIRDTAGVFATTVDIGMETDFDGDPYMKMMTQLLADRLAEATAERMHEEVRRKYWGYAPGESLSMDELHAEKFQGIRPAVGYPSMPDTSINFILDTILGFGGIGIRLTENGAMKPHASVSGLMIAHPKAHYFAVGRIGDDQLRDYARRRGIPVEMTRRFLASNIRQ